MPAPIRHSLFNHSGIVLVLMTILPALLVGSVAYQITYQSVRTANIASVGLVADAKREQLLTVLKGQNRRAASLLSEILVACRGRDAQVCQAAQLKSYLGSEAAMGVALYRGDQQVTSVGQVPQQMTELEFRPGQLAKFSGTGQGRNQSYFVVARNGGSSLQLTIVYPSSILQSLFVPPPELGVSGETFLADGEGYFVTPARYPSVQGHNDTPISARPMRLCLGGEDREVLDLDYRDMDIVHGFRFMPEFGSACIMAHIPQQEAFAPVDRLRRKVTLTLFILLLPTLLLALYFSRKMSRSEALLRASESKFHALFDKAKECKLLLSEDGRIVDINTTGHERLGYTKEEMLGRRIAEFDTPECAAMVPQRMEAIARDGHATFESAHVRKDGSVMPVEITSTLLDLDGRRMYYSVIHDISERKRAEEVMQRYKLVIDTAMDGFWMVDLQGTLLEVNDAYAKMTGYTVDELTGMHISQIEAIERPEDTAEHIAKIMREGYDRFETRHRHKDGRVLDIEVAVTLMHGSQRMFVFCRDITSRKEAEQRIAYSETLYRELIENMSSGVAVYSAVDGGEDFVFKDFNRAAESLEGVRRADIVGRRLTDCFPGVREFGLFAVLQRVWRGGVPEHFPLSFYHDDRISVWRDNYVYRMPSGEVVAVYDDVTARKQAEEALRQSEANLRAILDNSPYLTWLKDTEGRYITVNRVFADYLRLSGAWEVVGKTDLDLQPRELAEKYRADDAEVMNSREQKHVEEAAFDGRQTHWVETYKTPIIDEDGKILGTVGFAHDITERKEAEEALRVAAVAFETHDAILITDRNANIVRVNQAFTDITGYMPEEVLGQNPRIMSSGRQDKAFYIEMWQQLLHTGSWAGEIWDKRKSGQIYPKWMTITAVKNEQQETTHYVAIFSDITARKQAEEEIRNLAFYDALTKLPNRRLFLDRFRAALTTSARRDEYGAVLFIDLDRFKTLNDTLGHEYGDLLLIEVAARTRACVREMDTVARLGGDEFVVLLEGLGDEAGEASHKAGVISEKIRESLARPYKLRSHEHHSSPSIGVSLYHGNERSVDELVQQADMAMYQAKSAGRNTVRFFDPVMQHNVATRAELENDLHHAVELGQLQLYYQVQVRDGGGAVGAEALLRWQHPRRGLLMPAQFIPIAEDSTLIHDIGRWVLHEACRQLARWMADECLRGLVMAVNISARQFAQPDFVRQVEDALKMHGVEPSRLKLELTESLVLHDLRSTVYKMHELKKLGVSLSMDDFGTGYSSLSYLKDLPLDQLKIDQSFIRGIAEGGNDALLVRTIIDLAGNFRMDVIAEGVENEVQRDFLRRHECVAYQGYLFGKPVEIGEFERLVKERQRDGTMQ